MTDLSLLVLGRHDADTFGDLVTRAEKAGYDGLWYADERFFRDCWASLAVAATRSSRLRLGVCVTDPYVRHPALTAAAVATVDEISRGRMTLGLGAGIAGFRQMAIQRTKPLTAMREAIQLIRALLAGERVSLDGEVVRFLDGALDMPARADLPIVIATNGPKMLELAGELADGVIVQGLASVEMIESVRDHLRAGASRAGRDPDAVRLIARVDTCVAEDRAAARRVMRPGLVRHLATHHPHYNSFRLARVEVPDSLSEAVAEVGYGHGVSGAKAVEELVPDEFVDRFCLAGTPNEVAQQAARLISAGVADIAIYPVTVPGQSPLEIVESVARVVFPDACRLSATALEEAG